MGDQDPHEIITKENDLAKKDQKFTKDKADQAEKDSKSNDKGGCLSGKPLTGKLSAK